jgi:hypothetical protein
MTKEELDLVDAYIAYCRIAEYTNDPTMRGWAYGCADSTRKELELLLVSDESPEAN